MNWIQTLIIAIIEGLTEFLPVSSTGHMIIAQKILNVQSTEFVKAFTVIIQLGAILSVVVVYRKRFFQSFAFYRTLFIAFIPAAVFGFALSDFIDELLESVEVVAISLVLGGIIMLFVDKWFNKPVKDQEVTDIKALKIGVAQCIAMIPGVSRSMATIVGGMGQGLTRRNATEFSFFLAVPTMFAATAYKLLKLMMSSNSRAVLMENLDILIFGNVVAFIVALITIKFFISYVSKYGFKAFGYYRIILGSILLILSFLGINLNIT